MAEEHKEEILTRHQLYYALNREKRIAYQLEKYYNKPEVAARRLELENKRAEKEAERVRLQEERARKREERARSAHALNKPNSGALKNT